MRFFPLFLLLSSMTSCSFALPAVNDAANVVHTHTLADDPAYRYEGRIDFSRPQAPVLIWQGSTISFRTAAPRITLGFEQLQGEVFFDLSIGGKRHPIEAHNGWHTIELPYAKKPLTVELYKRTEAAAGTVAFLGIKAEEAFPVLPPSTARSGLKFLFIGDSITVGACNEDGKDDQWETVRTHNTAKSYGMLAANDLQAQYRSVAVSGVGIATGYKPYTAGEIWNRLYPSPTSALADLSLWQPDWVFINFGENDDSFTRNNNMSFPETFSQQYITLVKDVRRAYPRANIAILRGGMRGGAKSERLIEPWRQAVNHLEKQDKNLHVYVFSHWSHLHPRVSDHQIMATELSQWLRTKMDSAH